MTRSSDYVRCVYRNSASNNEEKHGMMQNDMLFGWMLGILTSLGVIATSLLLVGAWLSMYIRASRDGE